MCDKKNMCKRVDEFYCTFGEEPNCKYGENTDVGECDHKDENSLICTCEEAIEETITKTQPKPKRKPLSDGTLPLTESELIEFSKFYVAVKKVSVSGVFVIMNDCCNYTVDKYKAILWLSERFELTNNN